ALGLESSADTLSMHRASSVASLHEAMMAAGEEEGEGERERHTHSDRERDVDRPHRERDIPLRSSRARHRLERTMSVDDLERDLEREREQERERMGSTQGYTSPYASLRGGRAQRERERERSGRFHPLSTGSEESETEPSSEGERERQRDRERETEREREKDAAPVARPSLTMSGPISPHSPHSPQSPLPHSPMSPTEVSLFPVYSNDGRNSPSIDRRLKNADIASALSELHSYLDAAGEGSPSLSTKGWEGEREGERERDGASDGERRLSF
ncbi:hypothetical protein KIPB_008786, partial [Kipferlia bialata]